MSYFRGNTLSSYVSINSRLIYQDGGFFEGPDLLAELQGQSFKAESFTDCGEVFPAYAYRRPLDASALIASEAFGRKLTGHFDWINQVFSTGASTRVCRLTDVFVCRNTIYTLHQAELLTVYETCRPIDRPYTMPLLLDGHAVRRDAVQMKAGRSTLYLGSAGYFNYGHWLMDDLCRADAAALVVEATGRNDIDYAIPGHTPELNAVKTASIMMGEDEGLERRVCFVPPDAILHYDELFYASPVSYHPALKSPYVSMRLRQMAERLGGLNADPVARRIYVTRDRGRGRSVVNDEEIQAVLARFGFVTVTVEGMSFAEQIALFRGAEVVVGCMGAAMTSTVFCSSETCVLYLAPEGWMEPFYWDLAATCGQQYFALYGPSVDPAQEPHMASFSIDPLQLASLLSRVVG